MIKIRSRSAESDGVIINRPVVQFFMEQEVKAGQEFIAHGLFGARRNLSAQLEPQGAGPTIPVTILSKSRYELKLSLDETPRPDSTYKLVLFDLLNPWLRTEVPSQVAPQFVAGDASTPQQRSTGPLWLQDIESLPLIHLTDLDPTGLIDSRTRLQAHLTAAGSAGGARLRFPPGQFKIAIRSPAEQLKLPSGVVIEGSGKDLTQLDLQIAGDINAPWLNFDCRIPNRLIDCPDKPRGIRDLTIQSSLFQHPDFRLSYSSGLRMDEQQPHLRSRVVLQRVAYNAGTYESINISNATDIFIDQLEFDNPTSPWSPIVFDRNKRVEIRDSKLLYFRGRAQFTYGDKLVIRNSSIIRDVAFQPDMSLFPHTECCSGGIQLSLNKNVSITGNEIRVINALPDRYPGNNDSESINSELHTHHFSLAGKVASATRTSLTGLNADWDVLDSYPTEINGKDNPSNARLSGSVVPYLPRDIQTPVIAIVSGTGEGQWRRIQLHTRDTVLVDKPFDVTPDATSEFKIFAWNLENVRIVGNQISGGQQGFLAYDGGVSILIADNVFENTGAIALWSKDLHSSSQYFTPCRFLFSPGHAKYNGLTNWSDLKKCSNHQPLWNSLVLDNAVINSGGLFTAAIELVANNFQNIEHPETAYPRMTGVSSLANEIRGNILAARSPNNLRLPPESRYYYTRFNRNERIYAVVGGSAKDTQTSALTGNAMQGIIFQGNDLQNFDNTEPGIVTSLGVQAFVDSRAPGVRDLCVRLPNYIDPTDGVVTIALRDPSRFAHRYTESCTPETCDEYFNRKDVAVQRSVKVNLLREVRVDGFAPTFLAHFVRGNDNGGLAAEFRPVPTNQSFEVTIDSRGTRYVFPGIPLTSMTSGCATLGSVGSIP